MRGARSVTGCAAMPELLPLCKQRAGEPACRAWEGIELGAKVRTCAQHKRMTPGIVVHDPPAVQVWLAVEEKGIEYDTMFLNLREKPAWYKEMVPTGLVPAVKANGKIVYESVDILRVRAKISLPHLHVSGTTNPRVDSSSWLSVTTSLRNLLEPF